MTKGKRAGVAHERPYDVSLEAIRDGIGASVVQGDIAPGDRLVYNRRLDTLKVQCAPGVILRISPGRRFAEGLVRLMGAVEAETEKRTATVPDDAAACPKCGVLVREVKIGNKGILLDTVPDENGIYLILKPGRARILDAFEDPYTPTYREHRCAMRGAQK